MIHRLPIRSPLLPLLGLCGALFATLPREALAQDAPAEPPPPGAPSAAPPLGLTPAPVIAPAEAPLPGTHEHEMKPVTAPEPKAEARKEKPWYDLLNVGAFVDAYYSHNFRNPKPNAGANAYQPYTGNTGASLAWVGLDASVEPDPVGAVMQLRFGPAAAVLAQSDGNVPGGIGNLQNAHGIWKPTGKDGKITLIAGKFDTIYGAEVAQSQLNINYTRGFLYNLAQPFFHTGVRADVTLNSVVAFKVLAVNGWNNTVDNNLGKSFGAQVGITPNDSLTLLAGYLGGPEQSDWQTCQVGTRFSGAQGSCTPDPTATTASTGDVRGANSRWRHLADVVADWKPTSALRVVANGTFVTEAVVDSLSGADKNVSWYGGALFARYGISDIFGIAARGELVHDPDRSLVLPAQDGRGVTLGSGTLTLEAAPNKFLLLRLEPRLDWASSAVYPSRVAVGAEKTQLTTTFGVVAKTN